MFRLFFVVAVLATFVSCAAKPDAHEPCIELGSFRYAVLGQHDGADISKVITTEAEHYVRGTVGGTYGEIVRLCGSSALAVDHTWTSPHFLRIGGIDYLVR